MYMYRKPLAMYVLEIMGLRPFLDEAADTGKALHGRTTVGTPCFMAPEVLISDTDRDAEYDEKVDI